jgi:hypothetical protein
MVPVANARLLADCIPGAELRVVPGAGHAVPLEEPKACARMLVDWVERHAGLEPAEPGLLRSVGERATRPFALHAGALRNTRDALNRLARREPG